MFIAVVMLVILVVGFRRFWANRRNLDLSEAMSARAGYTMGGNWVQPLSHNQVVTEYIDDRYGPTETYPSKN